MISILMTMRNQDKSVKCCNMSYYKQAKTEVCPFILKVCFASRTLPLIRSDLTWSGKSIVLSCVMESTLLGTWGFGLKNMWHVSEKYTEIHQSCNFDEYNQWMQKSEHNRAEISKINYQYVWYLSSWEADGVSNFKYSLSTNTYTV